MADKKDPKDPKNPFDPNNMAEMIKKQMEAQMEMMKNIDMSQYAAQAAEMMKQFQGMGTGETEILIKEDTKLTKPQQWVMTITAILSHQTDSYVNDLEVAVTKLEAQQGLSNGWGIEDKQGFEEAIEHLINKGHRIYYNLIRNEEKKGTQGTPLKEQIAKFDQILKLQPGTMLNYYSNYKSGLRGLRAMEVLGEAEEVAAIDAWDFARLVNLCRMGYAAGYITEKEVWENGFFAARILQKAFSSWRELSVSFLLGRFFWSGNEADDMDEFIDFHKLLLENPKSPYLTIPWSLKLE